MTGNDFRTFRRRLGQGKAEFGWTLGYKGNHNTVKRIVVRAEALGKEPIPERLAGRVAALIKEK